MMQDLPAASRRRIEQLDPSAVVLAVGGWGKPLERADWVPTSCRTRRVVSTDPI